MDNINILILSRWIATAALKISIEMITPSRTQLFFLKGKSTARNEASTKK